MVKKSLLSGGLMALGAWLLGSFGAPAPAVAGKSCNYLNNLLFMAQGYQNGNGVWISEGWWEVEPGECIVYSDQAFTYFKIRDGEAPQRRAIAESEGSESTRLCQVNDRFTVYQAEKTSVCGNSGGSSEVFINPGSNLELIKVP